MSFRLKQFIAIAITVLTGSSSYAQSSPQSFSLQGRLVRPDSSSVDAASVDFLLQVRSPGAENCILFEETHTLNMTGTDGVFSLRLGTGIRSGTNFKDTSSLAQAFDNSASAISSLNCASGTSYDPANLDARKLRISFDEGSGAQTLAQDLPVQAVPYSLYADRLQGKQASDLLQIVPALESTPGTSQSRVNRLIDTDWAGLDALLLGTSSLYAKAAPTAAVSNNNQRLINVADPTGAQDAATKNYADTKIGGYTATVGVLAAGDAGKAITWDGTKWVATTISTTDGTKVAKAGDTMTGTLNLPANGLVAGTNQFVLSGGFVGIGTATPASKLAVSGANENTTVEVVNESGASRFPGINLKNFGTTGGYTGFPGVTLYNAGGTQATPTALPSGSVLGAVSMTGYDGAAFSANAPISIVGTTAEAFTASAHGANLIFNTTAIGSVTPSERLRITSAGNVGIGTTSPQSRLDVASSDATDNTVSVLTISRTRSDATAPGAGFGSAFDFSLEGFTDNQVATGARIGSGWNTAQSNDTTTRDAYLSFSTLQDNVLAERMRIFPGGNVGINTTTTSARLHVESSASVAGGIFSRNDDDSSSYSVLEIHRKRSSATAPSTGGFGGQLSFSLEGFTNDQMTRASKIEGAWENAQTNDTTDRDSFLGFTTMVDNSSSEKMRITSSGNVGIGISSPSGVLHLKAGTATAGTAPLKLSAGTNLTTPEAGAIEFDGTNLYYTNASNARQTLATTGGAGGGSSTSSSDMIFNSDSDNAGTDGGFSFQRNGSNLVTISNGGVVSVAATTASTSSTNGALVVGGGLGVAGNINSGGTVAGGTLRGSGLGSSQIYAERRSDSATGPLVSFSKGRSAGAALNGDVLGGLTLSPFTGASSQSFNSDPLLGYVATENQSNTNLGNSFELYTIPNGTNARSLVMKVTSSGNVGIGVTSAARLLHVNGPIRLNATALPGTPATGDIAIDSGDANAFKYYNGTTWVKPGASSLTVGQAAGTAMGADAVPNCTAAQKLQMSLGPTFAWSCVTDADGTDKVAKAGDTMTGTLNLPANGLVAGTTQLVLSGGNAGIGTASPAGRLHVAGSSDANQLVVQAHSTQTTNLAVFQNSAGSIISAVTGTGRFSGPVGAASSPSFTFNGSTSTGWYAPAADSIGASIAGTERLRIDSSGNVGIGTTSPTELFQVNKAQAAATFANVTNSSSAAGAAAGITLNSDSTTTALTSFGTGSGSFSQLETSSSTLFIKSNHATGDIRLGAGGGAERMRITSAGNVGIGTTSPTAGLHLKAGTAAASTAPLKLTAGTNLTTPEAGAIEFDGTNLYYTNSSNARQTLATSASSSQWTTNGAAIGYTTGNVGIGTTSPSTVLHVRKSAGAANVRLESTTGRTYDVTSDTTGLFRIVDNGSSNAVVFEGTTGNLALGTSAPTSIISLGGNAARTIAMERQSTANTAGNSLTIRAGGATSGATDKAGGDLILSTGASTGASYTQTKISLMAVKNESTTGTTDRLPEEVMQVSFGPYSVPKVVIGNPINGWSGFNVNYDSGDTYVASGAGKSVSSPGRTGIQVINDSWTNNSYSYHEMWANNLDGNNQLAYMAAVSIAGAAAYTPNLIFGVSTGSNTHAERMRIDSSGRLGIGVTTVTEMLEVNGNVKATSFISTSDRRLKRNIKSVRGLAAIRQLNGVSWDWTKTGKPDMGVIAQEVEAVFPDAVVTDPTSGYKAVKYNALIAPLVESVKELADKSDEAQSQNDSQSRELASLKDENNSLKAEVSSMKGEIETLSSRLERLERLMKAQSK